MWQAVLDGKWICSVTRTGEYSGVLTVENQQGEVVFKEDVSLAYGAVFGPDACDVALWEEKSVQVVDSQ